MQHIMKVGLVLVAVLASGTARASDMEDACLLGQETAALFYALIEKDPERAERMLHEIDTRIARRAYYWAIVYFERDESLHDLASNYLRVCLETGPVTLPAPQF